MNRRNFLTMTAAATAAGALAPNIFEGHSNAFRLLAGTPPVSAAEFSRHRKFANTRFGRIAYIDRGEGDAVLFLHGFPLNSFQWRDSMDRLCTHRRCIAPDFLGLGFSEVAHGQSVAPAAQVTMLATLLDQLSVKSVDIIANDSGGAVAQLFVVRYPERVRTMLLTNCDTEPDSPPPAVMPVIELARNGRFVEEMLAPQVKNPASARTANGLGGLCYSDPGHPTDEALEQYLAPIASSPERKALGDAYAIALAPNPLAGIEAKLKECRVPARIVWGTADTIFSNSSAEYLDRTLGNSKGVRRVPGAKLFFPEEYPELISEEALKLWRI